MLKVDLVHSGLLTMSVWDMSNKITIAIAIIAIIAAGGTVVITSGHVQAKKHTQCFKSGEDDGSAHNAFDSAQFHSCDKNY